MAKSHIEDWHKYQAPRENRQKLNCGFIAPRPSSECGLHILVFDVGDSVLSGVNLYIYVCHKVFHRRICRAQLGRYRVRERGKPLTSVESQISISGLEIILQVNTAFGFSERHWMQSLSRYHLRWSQYITIPVTYSCYKKCLLSFL